MLPPICFFCCGLLLFVSQSVAQPQLSQDEVIRRAREETIENQRAHAAAIAPVVWEQTLINNPGDPEAARRQYDAWAAANGVVGVATSRAAETFAGTRGTFEPNHGELIDDATRLRRSEAATENLRRRADEAARQRIYDDAELFLGTGTDPLPPGGDLVLPGPDDLALLFPRLDPVATWNSRFLRGADDEFAVIILNMPLPESESGGFPALAFLNQLLDNLDRAWHAAAEGLTPRVGEAAAAGATAATEKLQRFQELIAILDRGRDIDRRMAMHNDNYPDVPDPIPENQLAMWEQIVAAYNAEADALDIEHAELMTRIRAWRGH